MCLFPRAVEPGTVPYRHGMTEFSCGHCPECLKKKSSYWALLSQAYVADGHNAIMVTLTYDQYQHDKNGKIVRDKLGFPLELPPDTTIRLSVHDIQVFIKRLRRRFPDLKYICAGEYGEHTGRAHYHLMLFDVCFSDAVFYKKSKRGNRIYTSATLSKIWSHGICTIDCLCANAACASYCTKYTAKQRGADDTFITASRDIGMRWLSEHFSVRGYSFGGVTYPVPRVIWQRRLSARYDVSFRYVSPQREDFATYRRDPVNGRFCRAFLSRPSAIRLFRARRFRDRDPEYQEYIQIMRSLADYKKSIQQRASIRVAALPNDKFVFYKGLAFRELNKPFDWRVAPGKSVSPVLSELRLSRRLALLGIRLRPEFAVSPSCRLTANDRYEPNPFDNSEFFSEKPLTYLLE